MIKRLFVQIFWILLPVAVWGVSPSEAINRFLKESGLRPGSVGVKIVDLSDGRVVASHNPARPLIPASIMKSVTTAALLNETGIDYRFQTPVWTDGEREGSVLKGNIIIEAQGDPSINSPYIPEGADLIQEIIETLKSEGIERVEGRLLIDESYFSGSPRPPSWMAADFREAYGTGSHAFNFENNAIGSRSIENPKAVFEKRFKTRMAENGIRLEEGVKDEGNRTLLLTHQSVPIDDIMRSCMMRSDNLFAEIMLRTYGKVTGGDGSTERSAAIEYEMWKEKKLPADGVVIIDGSGLSRSNRVTADFMTGILQLMSDNADYASFFPLAGQEGTLKSFLADTALDSYMAMKTGSMKGIQCYAGYKLDEDYSPTHTVVIIMNEMVGSRDRVKKAAQRMLLDIFNDSSQQIETTANSTDN